MTSSRGEQMKKGELDMEAERRILLIFADGVGIGTDDAARNPFVRTVLPTLQKLGGGRLPTLPDLRPRSSRGGFVPLDATLGMNGTPQSGTGQASLLTGCNAARIFGRHFGPWTPVALRPLVEERSLLRRARDAGHSVAFANAYPRSWPAPGGSRRISAPPLAARGAGVLNRHEEALGRRQAVASGIVNDGWRTHLGHDGLPEVTAHDAGRTLAAIASEVHLTLYAHYATDTAGHRGGMDGAIRALERFDAFLGGVLEALPPACTLVVASDHGNVEDVEAQHTRNPALGALAGAGWERLAARLEGLTDVTPAILDHLASPGGEET